MRQLEIEYFFPLTEQIALDLDFKPCLDYAEEQSKKQSYTGYTLNSWAPTGTAWATIGNIEPSFCIDIDQTPLTVVSKNKPSIFRKYLYKIMGVKWKAK